LASPAFTPPDFDERLNELVASGELTSEQRNEVQAQRDRKLERNTTEARRLTQEIARRKSRFAGGDVAVVFGGDFNAEPDKPSVAAVKDAGYTEVAFGPEFHTWNPVVNAENYSIGTRRNYALSTFDNPEIEVLLDQRHDTPRQIDHLFVSRGIEVLEAEMVLDEPRGGIYLSDHFAILATLRLP
jgi:endonuclease/exonuclease/phosphatase family metal-dependent hydrolase